MTMCGECGGDNDTGTLLHHIGCSRRERPPSPPTTVYAGVNYAQYLRGIDWPSDSTRDAVGQPGLVDVATMTPQYAASALGKLVRWATHHPSGDMILIDDVTLREETARTSPLGLRLATRALGLTHPAELHALYADKEPI